MPINSCLAPFTYLLVGPKGRVSPCAWLTDYYLGDSQTQTLKEIWEGKETQEFRKKFSTSSLKECLSKQCYCFSDTNQKQLPELRRIEFSKDCLLLDEQSALNSVKEVALQGEMKLEDDKTISLIQKIKKICPDALWTLELLPSPQLKSAQEILKQIALQQIIISCDYINFNDPKTSLNILIENLYFLRPFAKIELNLAVDKNNWKQIPAFIDFAKDGKMSFQIKLKSEPTHLSLLYAPLDEKEETLSFLLDHCNDETLKEQATLISALMKNTEGK